MKLRVDALWLVGFRPFFSLACLAGVVLPQLWALAYTGRLTLPASTLTPNQWHAHEMFYGFGWAVLGGFLLTSTKNWVHVRGYHGAALKVLAAAWALERLAVWFAGSLPRPLFLVSANLFLIAIVALLLRTLLSHRAADTFRADNRFFLVALPLFIVAKNLLLAPQTFLTGTVMTLALFRLAFLVMLERTLTQFMKGAYQVELLRWPPLDNAIKVLALGLVFAGLVPPAVASAASLTLAALLTARFVAWKPHLAARRIDLFIMYLGALAIIAQLVVAGLEPLLTVTWVGNVNVHLFTFGAMGLIIPSMIMRIAKGHTGRPVVFDWLDKACLWVMIATFIARVVAPQLLPAEYARWLHAAAGGWTLCFAVLAWRYVPWLMAPRVDGKEH